MRSDSNTDNLFEKQEQLTVFADEISQNEEAINLYFVKKAVSNEPKFREYMTARVDVNDLTGGNIGFKWLKISDPEASLRSKTPGSKDPDYMLTSDRGSLYFKVQCLGDGEVEIALRGINKRDKKGQRIPVWINYTRVKINNEIIFHNTKSVWHDKPFKIRKKVKAGDFINCTLSWKAYDYIDASLLDQDIYNRLSIKINNHEAYSIDEIKGTLLSERKENLRVSNLYDEALENIVELHKELAYYRQNLPGEEDILSYRVKLGDEEPCTVEQLIKNTVIYKEQITENEKSIKAYEEEINRLSISAEERQKKLEAEKERLKEENKEHILENEKSIKAFEKEIGRLKISAGEEKKKLKAENERLKAENEKQIRTLSDENRRIKELYDTSCYELSETRKSKTYKIGRAITWLPRKVRGN